MALHISSNSPLMTRRAAAAFAPLLGPGDLLALTGPLGVGKTCFAQGLAEALGIHQVVASPSFVLAKHYPGRPSLLHIDAYRLASAEELWELGLEDLLCASVTVVEWADHVWDALPDERIEVELSYVGDQERALAVRGLGPRCQAVVAQLERFIACGGPTGGH